MTIITFSMYNLIFITRIYYVRYSYILMAYYDMIWHVLDLFKTPEQSIEWGEVILTCTDTRFFSFKYKSTLDWTCSQSCAMEILPCKVTYIYMIHTCRLNRRYICSLCCFWFWTKYKVPERKGGRYDTTRHDTTHDKYVYSANTTIIYIHIFTIS